jgi:hypothetical protein
MVRLLGKTPPSWLIPLSIATPIAKGSDVAAKCTGIDFTGMKLPSVSRLRLVSLRSFTDVNSLYSFTFVNSLRSFPITAARIEKFNRSTNFDAPKIREAGFTQPVSNEETCGGRWRGTWRRRMGRPWRMANGKWGVANDREQGEEGWRRRDGGVMNLGYSPCVHL